MHMGGLAKRKAEPALGNMHQSRDRLVMAGLFAGDKGSRDSPGGQHVSCTCAYVHIRQGCLLE